MTRARAVLALLAAFVATAVAPVVPPAGALASQMGRLVFVRNGDVFTARADGALVEQVTDTPAFDSGPKWAPDFVRIAFTRRHTGVPQVHVVNYDGTGERQVTTSPFGATDPTWSGNGGRIAFVEFDEAGRSDIWSVNVVTGHRVRHTSLAGDVRSPAWSPDGRWILFTDFAGRLSVVHADGGPVARYPLLEWDDHDDPAWAPEGSRIVTANGSIRKMGFPVHVGPPVVIAFGGDHVHSRPAFSPNGRQVVLTRVPGGAAAPPTLFVVDADGTDLRSTGLAGDQADW